MSTQHFLNPAYGTDETASEWNQYLADNCVWSADDFGGDYAWSADVPARDTWEQELAALNKHLRDTNMNTKNIAIRWTSPGHYWLGNSEGTLTLGECATEAELRAAVSGCVDAGTGEESWDGWTAERGEAA